VTTKTQVVAVQNLACANCGVELVFDIATSMYHHVVMVKVAGWSCPNDGKVYKLIPTPVTVEVIL
jgi:hypothetical protein